MLVNASRDCSWLRVARERSSHTTLGMICCPPRSGASSCRQVQVARWVQGQEVCGLYGQGAGSLLAWGSPIVDHKPRIDRPQSWLIHGYSNNICPYWTGCVTRQLLKVMNCANCVERGLPTAWWLVGGLDPIEQGCRHWRVDTTPNPRKNCWSLSWPAFVSTALTHLSVSFIVSCFCIYRLKAWGLTKTRARGGHIQPTVDDSWCI